MYKIGIIGGSQPEMKQFVKEATLKYKDCLEFHIFDTDENIADNNFWSYYPFETPERMALEAVKKAHTGEIDILVKGIVSTYTFLKAILNKEYSLKEESILSHVAIIDLPKLERKLLLTDSAMNIQPSREELIVITKQAIGVAQNIGIEQPKVALLSAAENFNPKMPSSILSKEVTEYFKESDDAIVHGPLSLDLALSKTAVENKRFSGPVAGDADILVVPTIDVGNVLYKSLVIFGDAVMGGTIIGTKVPVVLTSRSDSIKSKLVALDLAVNQIKE